MESIMDLVMELMTDYEAEAVAFSVVWEEDHEN